MIYVVAKERGLVRVRTDNCEGEDVYSFRINVNAERARQLLHDYLSGGSPALLAWLRP